MATVTTIAGPTFYAILESETNRTIHLIGYLRDGKKIISARPVIVTPES